MEKVKENVKKFFSNGRGVIFAIFILHLFLIFFITPNKYDDEFFLEQVTNRNILSFVRERYTNWSSRIFIETALCFVLKTSKYLWILVEALLFTLAAYSISRLFIKKDERKQNNVILLFMILIYPFEVMNSSGWAATTTNYMWPLATTLFALIPIRKIWDNEKIRIWEYPLYILALLFGANQEQSSAILVGTYILFSVFFIIKNKKLHPIIIIQTVLSIISIIFILTCPGNYTRQQQEIVRMFPDYEMYNVLDKISLGLTTAMGVIIKQRDWVYIMLSLLCVVYIWSTYKEKVYRVVAAVPIFSIIFFGFNTKDMFHFIGSFRKLLIADEVTLTAANCNNLVNVLPIIFAFANFICIGLSIMLIFKNLKNNIALLVYLVGLASKLILGFSPTVFSSAERSTIFFEFSMIIVSLLIWQEFLKKTDKNDKKIQNKLEIIIKSTGILQYINVLLCVLLTQK